VIPKGKPSKKFFREQEYLEQLPMTRDHPQQAVMTFFAQMAVGQRSAARH
jgi:hypothetical protein